MRRGRQPLADAAPLLVAARPDGGAVVVWIDETGEAFGVEATVVNSAGVETTPGGELAVAPSALTQSSPDVAILSDGSAIIVWDRTVSPTNNDVDARILNAAGTAFTTAIVQLDNALTTQENPAVAASGLSALVVYEDSTAGGTTSTDIIGRLFNGATDTFGTEFVIANSSVDLQAAKVAALPDNRFVIVYDGGGTTILARIFDPETPDGPFVSSEIVVAVAGSGLLTGFPSIAAAVDGGFVVVWQEGAFGQSEVLERRYDAHGAGLWR